MSTISDASERDLIARIRASLTTPAPSWLVVGIGDDAAVVEHERNHLEVLTVDAIVDGVHFDRAFTPPDAIGHRALAVNLSDLAAMGAKPRLVLLSMALPPTLPLIDFDAIISGFTRLAATHYVHVVGGNLTRTPGPLTIDITAIGSARRRQVMERRGAHAGDELYVTGHIGTARAGLAYLQSLSPDDAARACHAVARSGAATQQDDVARPFQDREDTVTGSEPPPMDDAVRRYLYPDARLRSGLLVARNRAASACMDLSDGLLDAVTQVAEASGVGATLDPAAFPLDDAARAWFKRCGLDATIEALHGGDDYELLFAVPRRRRRSFHAAMRLSGISVSRVGVCTPEIGVRLEGSAAVLGAATGFRHFR